MSTHRQPSCQCSRHEYYLLTCDAYDELLERTDNCCELCDVRAEDTPHGRLDIDHDARHGTWAVRGLLCSHCNTGLGYPRQRDERTLTYLARTALPVPRPSLEISGYLTADLAAARLRVSEQRLLRLAAGSRSSFLKPRYFGWAPLWKITKLDAWRAKHPARKKPASG